MGSLVTAGTAPTPTTNALNRLLLFQLRLGHAADAGGIEVCLFGLDAAETAELERGGEGLAGAFRKSQEIPPVVFERSDRKGVGVARRLTFS